MKNSIHKHVFVFNKRDNGGESLSLETKYIPNGDRGGFFTNQTLVLNSYCNSASFELIGAQLSPKLLRQLADQLEKQEVIAKEKLSLQEQTCNP
jgi:hypothetical protein